MKKIIIFFCLLLSVFSIAIFLTSSLQKNESEVFQAYVTKYFEETLSQDGLSMHFSLLNPSQYGITSVSKSLPIYEQHSYYKQQEHISQTLEELSSIQLEKLSLQEQTDYQKLSDALVYSLELTDYPYYANPLTPDSGMQIQLLILLAEYRFHTREDIENYFSILQSVPDYLNGLYLYLSHRTEEGLLTSHTSLTEVSLQCSSILTREQIESQSHFLVETFLARLEVLLKDSSISHSEYSNYIDTNKDLLLYSLLPAYETLAENLLTLEGSLEEEKRLSIYPNGTSYYQLQLQHATASSKSIDQLKELLTNSFKDTYLAYYQKVQSIEELQKDSNQLITVSLPFTDTNDMVADLRFQMELNFPLFPNSSTKITYEIKEVSSSLEPYTAPAFYITPPIDHVYENTIYVNYESSLDSLSLYTTLAHEGFPGHLYQSVYHYLSTDLASSQLLTPLLSYLGYVEGWAVYVENLSYEYAKNTLPNSEERELIELYIDVYQLSRNLQLCFYSLLDIGIHYDGIDYADTHELLFQFGITDPAQTLGIYQYIVSNPTNYPTYYVGYCEVLECQELAMDLWGDNYSDLTFHTLFLEEGPNNFEIIKEKIALY